MDKAALVPLGHLCEVVSGTTPSTSNPEYWNGELNWVTPAELSDDEHVVYDTMRKITHRALEKSKMRLMPAGTVLLSSRAPIGKVAIAGVDMYCNQGFKNLICSPLLYNKYLFWFLKANNAYLNSLGRGATFKEISTKIVENVLVPLPSIKEQKQVATQLDTVSDMIRLRKQQLEELDLLVKSRFVEMFGTFPENNLGWDIGTIRDVIEEARYGTSRPAVDDGQYPYLRMNNITYEGELDFTDTKRIDIPENELPKCSLIKGDVLFNRTNSKELVGKTCVYDRDELMVLAGFVIRIRVNKRVISEFLSAFMNAHFTKQTLLGMSKAAIGQANINAQEMQSMGIYIPPIELQENFLTFKQQTDKSKFVINQSLAELETLKQSLMQKYFRNA